MLAFFTLSWSIRSAILPELLALLLSVRRVPGNVGGAAIEEVWHEHLILVLLVAVRQDVGALKGLREETEDVVDDEEG